MTHFLEREKKKEKEKRERKACLGATRKVEEKKVFFSRETSNRM